MWTKAVAKRTPPPKQSRDDASMAPHAGVTFRLPDDVRIYDLKHSGSRLRRMGMNPVSTIVITLTTTSSMVADRLGSSSGLDVQTHQRLLYLVEGYALGTTQYALTWKLNILNTSYVWPLESLFVIGSSLEAVGKLAVLSFWLEILLKWHRGLNNSKAIKV